MREFPSFFIPVAFVLLVAVKVGGIGAEEPEVVSPLALAHAHNDYLHDRPLLDALQHGFTSVEADIFLVDGKLLVGHTRTELKPERTLESLYLDPLRKRMRAGGGRVYPGSGRFHLLIDIKTDAEPTYKELAKVLGQYAGMISVVRNGQAETKAIDVTISGNRPMTVLAGEAVRYAGLDGRLSDLDSTMPSHLMPLISDNWNLHFQWKGQGPMGEEDWQKLAEVVKKAHARGRQIRFWATPDTAEMWRVLKQSGVDWINTDDLSGLETFLRSESENDSARPHKKDQRS